MFVIGQDLSNNMFKSLYLFVASKTKKKGKLIDRRTHILGSILMIQNKRLSSGFTPLCVHNDPIHKRNHKSLVMKANLTDFLSILSRFYT